MRLLAAWSAVLLFGATVAGAQMALDPAFGDHGILQFGEWRDLQFLADGTFFTSSSVGYPDRTVVIRRYAASGVLDTSYGDHGVLNVVIRRESTSSVIGRDGAISMMIGTSQPTAPSLLRITPAGTIASTTPLPPSPTMSIGAIAVQDDGKLVAAGSEATPYYSIPAVYRWRTDGTPDPAFGSNGVAMLGIFPCAQLYRLSIDSNQRIVVGGVSLPQSCAESRRIVIARYLSDGTPDSSLAAGGVTFACPGTYPTLRTLGVTATNRIVYSDEAGQSPSFLGISTDVVLIGDGRQSRVLESEQTRVFDPPRYCDVRVLPTGIALLSYLLGHTYITFLDHEGSVDASLFPKGIFDVSALAPALSRIDQVVVVGQSVTVAYHDGSSATAVLRVVPMTAVPPGSVPAMSNIALVVLAAALILIGVGHAH